jgi:hypothetical protein
MIGALENLADTLTDLALDARGELLEPFAPISSLEKFHKLQYFEITPTLLLGTDQSLSRTPRYFPTEYDSSPEPEEDDNVDVLPPSLSHIVLHDPQSKNYDRAAAWLSDVLMQHKTFAPGLKLLDIREWSISTATCSSGRRIAFAMNAGPSLRGRMRLPSWFDSAFKHILKD